MNFKLFPALFDNPENIRLGQQEADEHIEILLRQHWFTTLSWMVIAFLGIIFPFVFSAFDGIFTNVLPQIPSDIVVAIVILWYMLMTAYILEKYLYWYFNIYIVTNIHIVDVAMASLLSKTSTEVTLEDVQSVKTHILGVFGSLFNFGDVIIKTAADTQEILFVSVPNPDFVAERIQDLRALVEPQGGRDVS
ncbi:MAG: PH domain-containing protein [Candidatus Daviesbacteria bacterium]|nr:PH domain-containing protein [Candidatus Daviesbacteria bacterium]